MEFETEDIESSDTEFVSSFELSMLDPTKKQGSGEQRRLLKEMSDSEAEDPKPTKAGNYDEALAFAGFGKFHVILVLVCGWANASDAVEILSVSFLLPAAAKDLELTDQRKGVLSAIVFVGMLVGGYVWGALADVNGRRKTLIFSLATNAFFGLMSSLSQSYQLFITMRFFSGVGVGGSIPVIFSYFGEFQPKERRGMMISVLSTFWMAGNIVTAALALAIIPSGIGVYNPNGFSFNSWRVFVAFCTLPALTSVLTFIWMPESPKYLLENGHPAKALNVLKTVYSWNKWADKDDYPVNDLIPSDRVRQIQPYLRIRGPCGRWLAGAITTILVSLKMTVELFRKPLTWATSALLLIIWTLAFGYYGLWMWMPQLFALSELGSGSVCDSVSSNTSTNPTELPADDKQIYWDSFYTSLSNLPGNLVAIFFVDILGRKILLSTSLLLSGVTVFFIWFVDTRMEVLIVFCCFGGVSVVAWNMLNVLAVEVYPTHMRSTALGVQGIVNRLASIVSNIIFGLLIHSYCTVNILLVAALLVFGGFMTITLPKTKNISLQ